MAAIEIDLHLSKSRAVDPMVDNRERALQSSHSHA